MSMGVAVSAFKRKKVYDIETLEKQLNFSKEEVEILRKQWSIMMSDADANGIMLFTALFAIDGHLRTKFAFGDVYGFDCKTTFGDERLLGHLRGVFSSVEMLISSLVQNTFYESLGKIKELGKVHSLAGIHLSDLQAFKKAMIQTLKKELKSEFDDKALKAWSKFIDIVIEAFDVNDNTDDEKIQPIDK